MFMKMATKCEWKENKHLFASQTAVFSTVLLENDLSLLACVFPARAKEFKFVEFTEVMQTTEMYCINTKDNKKRQIYSY